MPAHVPKPSAVQHNVHAHAQVRARRVWGLARGVLVDPVPRRRPAAGHGDPAGVLADAVVRAHVQRLNAAHDLGPGPAWRGHGPGVQGPRRVVARPRAQVRADLCVRPRAAAHGVLEPGQNGADEHQNEHPTAGCCPRFFPICIY